MKMLVLNALSRKQSPQLEVDPKHLAPFVEHRGDGRKDQIGAAAKRRNSKVTMEEAVEADELGAKLHHFADGQLLILTLHLLGGRICLLQWKLDANARCWNGASG